MKKLYQTFARMVILAFFILSFSQAFAEKDTVVNTNSSGLGSLAAAIDSCNMRVGVDTIVFALPEDQSMTINLTAPLPAISDTVFIDGYSQPGATQGDIATRLIRVGINGSAMSPQGHILLINADGVSIAGLAIYLSQLSGVRIESGADGAHVWGNYIGTDTTGTTPGLGCGFDGIVANTFAGLPVIDLVIGTNGDGTNDANEGNLICSNLEDGIFLWAVQGSTIAGNIIGLDKNGSGSLGNGRNGILNTVAANGNTIGTDGDGISDNLEGNRICNNVGRGILIASVSNANIVAGNIVGLDAANNAAGNGTNGIEIFNGSDNRIGTNGDGTSDPVERNIICSNTGDGIRITADDFFGLNSNSDGNVVAGNAIGTNAAGVLVRGNTLAGVTIFAAFDLSASDNIIGSNNDASGDDSEGNIIANNAVGIATNAPAGATLIAGNKFSRNSIFNNLQLGIDLHADGVTSNDDGDGDAGANELFNFPVITSAQLDGSNNLIISGFSRPGSVIEFYIADAGPNPFPLPGGYTKSFGEGRTYLFRAQEGSALDGINDDSTTTGTYDGNDEGTGTGGTRTENKFGFSIPAASLPAAVSGGTRITALAYQFDAGSGNTSEFGGILITAITPVNLTSFRGRLNDDKVYLNWTTSEEHNNSHFEVERSSNGSSFEKVGEVIGKGGINNEYAFTDNGPLSKVNYYRLKQVDIDGKFTYTRTIVLRNDLGTIKGTVAPNPFVSNLNVSYKLDRDEKVHIRIYDQMGRMLKYYQVQGNKGTNTHNLNDLGTLPAGTYTIEVKGDNIKFQQKLVK